MSDRDNRLDGFEFSGCGVYDRAILAFWGQKWRDDDALGTRLTGIFLHYPDDPPADRWAHSIIGYAGGIHGTAAFQPGGAWVFVLDDGEVYVIGGGHDDYEPKISAGPAGFFTNVKCLPGGQAVAVGTHRKVFRRERAGHWVPLGGALPGGDAPAGEVGFRDIAGFAPADLYACGGVADLWHYDGTAWAQVDLPTRATLRNVCCASDGQVYITTDARDILVGRDRSWRVLHPQATVEVLESIVDFGGRVLVSTATTIFEIVAGVLQPASLGAQPAMRLRGHLAAGDGVLLVAGKDEAALYDGAQWRVLLTPAA